MVGRRAATGRTLAALRPKLVLPPELTDLTPTQTVAWVRQARDAAEAAEVRVLQGALAWARAHPDLDRDGQVRDWEAPATSKDGFGDGSPDVAHETAESFGWFGIPPMRWEAAASFAAANNMSTIAGRAFIRDALVLFHRLPITCARVISGEVPVHRGRRVAQIVLGQPKDVVESIDETIAPVAGSIGSVLLDRALDEALLRLYPEEREADQLEALDACHVTLDKASLNHTGIAEMVIRGDWSDLKAFEVAVAGIAAALKTRAQAAGELVEPLNLRRTRAVGILADPATALALLADPTGNGTPADPDVSTEPAQPDPSSKARKPRKQPKPFKQLELIVHLSEAAVDGRDPFARDHTGRPFLAEVIRDWAGRADTHVVVRPVVDLNAHHHASGYDIIGDLRFVTEVISTTCVFPWCARASVTCDKDHIVPYDHTDPARGGPSCSCNIAPLCRHHHNLKTHAGWSYTRLDHGRYRWRDPCSQTYLVDDTGTRHLPEPRAPDAAATPEPPAAAA